MVLHHLEIILRCGNLIQVEHHLSSSINYIGVHPTIMAPVHQQPATQHNVRDG